MSSATAATALSIPSASTATVPRRQCMETRKEAGNDSPVPCNRRVVWTVEGVGNMCNFHFEVYFDNHWQATSVDSIRRLSDKDSDFMDYGSNNGNGGGRPRKNPIPTNISIVE